MIHLTKRGDNIANLLLESNAKMELNLGKITILVIDDEIKIERGGSGRRQQILHFQ